MVTVQPGLRTCCADRKNVIQECENPIAPGDFKWIFACNGSARLNCYERGIESPIQARLPTGGFSLRNEEKLLIFWNRLYNEAIQKKKSGRSERACSGTKIKEDIYHGICGFK